MDIPGWEIRTACFGLWIYVVATGRDPGYEIRTSVPAIISKAPTIVLTSKVSPKKITDKMMAMATLILSTGATCETFPN